MVADAHSRHMPTKRFAPAAARNRDPILDVLRRVLPAEGLVLEVAAGTGEHGAHFAPRLPRLTWQPSEVHDLDSIEAWVAETAAPNLLAPIRLDVTAWPWPVDRVDAVFCANMIHIAPWACAEGLVRGAGRVLRAGGVLALYGPFRIGGAHVSDSNAAFDADLRARDPRWGVRDLEQVAALAAANGLHHAETVEMPANNRTVVFVKENT